MLTTTVGPRCGCLAHLARVFAVTAVEIGVLALGFIGILPVIR